MTRSDVGDRRRDAIRQLDHLNLVTSQLGFGLEGRTFDFDECRLSGLGDALIPLEEIGGAYRGKDVVEVVSEYQATVYADHSLSISVEEDELKVADLACVVVNAVIEGDGIGTGFCGGYQAELVVPRARRVPDDEGEAAHGDGE